MRPRRNGSRKRFTTHCGAQSYYFMFFNGRLFFPAAFFSTAFYFSTAFFYLHRLFLFHRLFFLQHLLFFHRLFFLTHRLLVLLHNVERSSTARATRSALPCVRRIKIVLLRFTAQVFLRSWSLIATLFSTKEVVSNRPMVESVTVWELVIRSEYINFVTYEAWLRWSCLHHIHQATTT